MIAEQTSLMEHQPTAANINPKALMEKELEEARAVFEKHGLQIPGEAQSKASSIMLFGDNGKTEKAKYKVLGIENGESRANSIVFFGKEQQSEVGSSVGRAKSAISGKFLPTGGTNFGECSFVRKGLANGN
jgi:hypothetical protein